MSNFKVYKPFNKEEPRQEVPSPKFLVNDRGHLENRTREEGAHSFPEFEPTGKSSFGFTPMGFVRHEVRPNVKFLGVRSDLGQTNPSAHHFLSKTDPDNHHRISTSGTGCNNERTIATKTKFSEYYNIPQDDVNGQFTNSAGGLNTKTLTRLQHVNKNL
jgi:hypothetical protein